jgi:hypothetical protein
MAFLPWLTLRNMKNAAGEVEQPEEPAEDGR